MLPRKDWIQLVQHRNILNMLVLLLTYTLQIKQKKTNASNPWCFDIGPSWWLIHHFNIIFFCCNGRSVRLPGMRKVCMEFNSGPVESDMVLQTVCNRFNIYISRLLPRLSPRKMVPPNLLFRRNTVLGSCSFIC